MLAVSAVGSGALTEVRLRNKLRRNTCLLLIHPHLLLSVYVHCI
jgi:hypothetical protein